MSEMMFLFSQDNLFKIINDKYIGLHQNIVHAHVQLEHVARLNSKTLHFKGTRY